MLFSGTNSFNSKEQCKGNILPTIVLKESLLLAENIILKPVELTSYLNKSYGFKPEEEFYQFLENVKRSYYFYEILEINNLFIMMISVTMTGN